MEAWAEAGLGCGEATDEEVGLTTSVQEGASLVHLFLSLEAYV